MTRWYSSDSFVGRDVDILIDTNQINHVSKALATPMSWVGLEHGKPLNQQVRRLLNSGALIWIPGLPGFRTCSDRSSGMQHVFFACVHAKLEIQHGLITQVEATPDPGRAGAKSCLVCLDQTTAVITCYTVRYSSGFEAMLLPGH